MHCVGETEAMTRKWRNQREIPILKTEVGKITCKLTIRYL